MSRQEPSKLSQSGQQPQESGYSSYLNANLEQEIAELNAGGANKSRASTGSSSAARKTVPVAAWGLIGMATLFALALLIGIIVRLSGGSAEVGNLPSIAPIGKPALSDTVPPKPKVQANQWRKRKVPQPILHREPVNLD